MGGSASWPFAVMAAVALLSCENSDSAPTMTGRGNEGEPCFSDGTCTGELVCLSDQCVYESGGGGESGSGGSGAFAGDAGQGGSAGSSGHAGRGGSSGHGGSAGSGHGGSGGSASNGFGQKCVDLINGYRATLGLPPYTRWVDGEVCSNGEAKSDSQTGQAHGAFGACGEWAQNECPGWPGPAESMIGRCLQAMWDEGPGSDFPTHGHYINMSSTSYTQVACGYYEAAGGVWAVQNFR